SPSDYWASSPNVVRNVLRAFDVQHTVRWFASMGVKLVAENSGKYFPETNQARTILDALVGSAQKLGCILRTGCRVEHLSVGSHGFQLKLGEEPGNVLWASRVIVATGGLALPKSGSDGVGLQWLRSLGHSIVEPVPALVPLVLQADETVGGRFAEFAGVSFPGRVRFISISGDVYETCGPVLFTHFGISGPAILDISRHVSRELRHGGRAPLLLYIGHERFHSSEEALAYLRRCRAACGQRQVSTILAELFPARLARCLAGSLAEKKVGQLNREQMLQLARTVSALTVRVIGDKGFALAEVTAGGVDLREIDWRSMESRLVPGLHLCGEILDVDGRIGGFNFQWAWSSGSLAGKAAAQALLKEGPRPR
ncbi:MAG: aminoacetone oxidase family FAD-binding enzyme, partial [Candidatus Sumerlaeaceae bacterium]|nr:aminoacetone oxidase family FAD-binding enzyme [Candidatus Sumerlaeaceae bacterium]